MMTLLSADAQSISGRILDANGEPLRLVEVSVNEIYKTTTNELGQFNIQTETGAKKLSFALGGQNFEHTVNVDITEAKVYNLDDIQMIPGGAGQDGIDIIPTISLSAEDSDQDDENQDFSGLLSASRDPFVDMAAFTFSSARFRIRGYDAENTLFHFNGIPVNNIDDGRVFYNAWGGLNDVLRNRDVGVGLGLQDFSIGGVGGAVNINTRARNHRPQTRVSYANSNRSYRHRLMGTYSTGMRTNGWAFTVSGSRRLANEGFVEGSFYDAYSYFLSVDRRINNNHFLNLTFFGSPTKRGRSTASTQEVYDLLDNNFYNPYWGYQAGEKRNSRVSNTHTPTAMLVHDWSINNSGAKLTNTLYYHQERNGSSSLDWGNARNPAADYYQKLPSFQSSDLLRNEMTRLIQADPSLLQINWARFYDANSINFQTIENANGTDAAVSGLRSHYILGEQRFDSDQMAFSSNLTLPVGDRQLIFGKLEFINSVSDNFRVVDDLLGGDYFLDVDRFIDPFLFPGGEQNDLNVPNKTVGLGDRYSWNYEIHHQQANINVQSEWSLPRIDVMLAAQVGSVRYWRDGKYRNGVHPDDSFGESEKLSFTTYSAKAGLTYKFSGRQYLFANAMSQARAPYSRYAFASPRVWNEIVPDLNTEKILSGELGYVFRSPRLKAQAVGYVTQFNDGIRNTFFFNDSEVGGGADFINLTDQNVDKRHQGLELSAQLNVSPTVQLSAVAAVGEYQYTSRFESTIINDDQANIPEEPLIVYSKNFNVPGTPNTALGLGISYNSPKFWFARLTGSYYKGTFLDFSRVRRTQEFFDLFVITEADPLLDYIVDQVETDEQFALDFFGGKSFKFGDYFVNLTVGVSNILDDRNRGTGGFEQSRWRVNDTTGEQIFGPKVFYGYGRNYFTQISLRF